MPKQGMGIGVEIRDNNIDKALKRFKKKIKNSNLMLAIFENEAYVKPSVKKRQKKLKALARNKYKLEELKREENRI
jgi:small subunit ribosomal protein S21